MSIKTRTYHLTATLLLSLSLSPVLLAQAGVQPQPVQPQPVQPQPAPVFDHDPMSVTVGYVPTVNVLKVLPAAGANPYPARPRPPLVRQVHVPALAVTDPYNKVQSGVPLQIMVNTSTDAGTDEIQVRFYAGFSHTTNSFGKRLQEGTDYEIDAASAPITDGKALFRVTFLLPQGQNHRKIIIAAWKKSEKDKDDRVTAFQTINVYQ